MRFATAIVCAVLAGGAPACTIGPTTGDDGGATSSTPARSRGDQCESVLSVFCQKAASCAIPTDSTCISGEMALCCVGSACNETSTVSEDTVTACEQAIMAEDCNDVVNTMQPTSCLGSP